MGAKSIAATSKAISLLCSGSTFQMTHIVLALLLISTTIVPISVGEATARPAASIKTKECSWEPRTSTLDCRLDDDDRRGLINEVYPITTTKLVFPKRQREATSILRLSCGRKTSGSAGPTKGKRGPVLKVNYGLGRGRGWSGSNLWPHLQTLVIRDCPLTTLRVSLDGGHKRPRQQEQGRGNDDVLEDVVRPLLGRVLPSGIRHLEISGDKDLDDLSSGSWCSLGPNLISLNLSENALSRVPLHLRTHHNATQCAWSHVEVVNLAGNKITRIDKKETASVLTLASASSSFARLDLSSNRLQQFELPDMAVHLTHVDLSNNRLFKFPNEALDASAVTLQEIQLQGNLLSSLPSSSLSKKMTSLVLLNVSRNDIEMDGGGKFGSLVGMTNLVALDLSHNKIEGKVEAVVFEDLASLQVLSLAHNQIRGLASDSLASLKRLHVLVLSHNDLDDAGLPEGVFRHLKDLRSLSLDHNRIRDMPR